METTFESSSVSSALQRIKNTLNYSLKENYGIEDPEVTEKFLKLHGLDKSRFDFINNFETLIEKGIADESVDTNANKCDKSIAGFFVETSLPIRKLVGYRYLYRKMKDLYGKKEAKRLSGEMYDMSLALADSTNILVPYCYSINASKLVMEGRPFGSLPSGIPHRITSYIMALCETVHQLSNHLAGAIAIGSCFFDIAHLIIYREHKTLTDVKTDLDYRKYLENSFQGLIHSLNMLSRNAVESPFSNISIFDRPKILALIDDDNLGWYFQKEDMIDGVPENALKDCEDKDWHEYIVELIKELEDIFMDVMDNGDPLHDNRVIEFPVVTFNISRTKQKDGTYTFEDDEWVKHFCDTHDIYRYNIYVSEGMKVASCCLAKDQLISYYDENGVLTWEKIKQYVEDRLPTGKEEYRFHESDLKEKVTDPNTGNQEYIIGVRRIENKFKKLIHLEFEDGTILDVTPNHKLYDKNSKELVTAQEILENPEKYNI